MPDSAIAALSDGWRMLRLAAAAPDRIASWDAIVLTAASPAQAALYRHRLERLHRLGRVPGRTRLVVVADPDGKRIGSGGATLNVLRALPDLPATARILVVHAGGDSRRLPWASIIGKAFVPVPLLADPDQGCPSLFEHCLAACATMPSRLPAGGMVLLSGDVLPLVPPGELRPATDGVTVVVAPAPLAIALRHGVAVVDGAGRVSDLLQKPSVAELTTAGGVLPGGTALIDTGIWCFAGQALVALRQLACADPDPVAEILADGRELSLYEELAAAWLPTRAAWLAGRPLGARLLRLASGAASVAACVAPSLRFLHFGTGTEVADHLAREWDGRISRRILADSGPGADPAATILHSRLDPRTTVGGGSLVVSSRLGAAVRIGQRCVVVGAEVMHEPLRLPDHCSLWQVAVSGGGWVTAVGGVDDNPKDVWPGGRFLNRDAAGWMAQHRITAEELWGDLPPAQRIGWNARLFPVQHGRSGLAAMAWMLGDGDGGTGERVWRGATRISLAELGRRLDAVRQAADDDQGSADLLVARLSMVVDGAVDGHAADLARQLPAELRDIASAFADRAMEAPAPPHRRHRLSGDLIDAAGGDPGPSYRAAWQAVSQAVSASLPGSIVGPVTDLAEGRAGESNLPVRIDIAGGWSDTPPYCLDHPARVLNLAVDLDGRKPIGCRAEAQSGRTLRIRMHDGAWITLDAAAANAPADVTDPLVLPRLAAQVCGFAGAGAITQGAVIDAWSRIPKGSGLGGSSILAAAMVQALQRLAGRADDPATVMGLVLLLEQRLSSGGGWQDQLGGLLPGAKLLSSLPVRPLSVAIEAIPLEANVLSALHGRLVLAYTGVDRLARDVLQRVMGRYLSRDRAVVGGIGRLVDLADDGRRLLAAGDLDGLGDLVGEVWAIHQELDPHCSNPAVEDLLADLAPLSRGWKLVGAGGGGFALIVARDLESAGEIRRRLAIRPRVLLPAWSVG